MEVTMRCGCKINDTEANPSPTCMARKLVHRYRIRRHILIKERDRLLAAFRADDFHTADEQQAVDDFVQAFTENSDREVDDMLTKARDSLHGRMGILTRAIVTLEQSVDFLRRKVANPLRILPFLVPLAEVQKEEILLVETPEDTPTNYKD